MACRPGRLRVAYDRPVVRQDRCQRADYLLRSAVASCRQLARRRHRDLDSQLGRLARLGGDGLDERAGHPLLTIATIRWKRDIAAARSQEVAVACAAPSIPSAAGSPTTKPSRTTGGDAGGAGSSAAAAAAAGIAARGSGVGGAAKTREPGGLIGRRSITTEESVLQSWCFYRPIASELRPCRSPFGQILDHASCGRCRAKRAVAQSAPTTPRRPRTPSRPLRPSRNDSVPRECSSRASARAWSRDRSGRLGTLGRYHRPKARRADARRRRADASLRELCARTLDAPGREPARRAHTLHEERRRELLLRTLVDERRALEQRSGPRR